ncbi:MAG: HIT domain-containing protein [Patescibacteria group bacterium]
MSCRFCTIINDETEHIVAYREHCFVLLSNPRLVPGHLLIIPRRHVEKPSELNQEERTNFFDTALEFQDYILGYVASGCDMRQHCKPFLPESLLKVNHVHAHLLPREFQDELYLQSQKDDEHFTELSEKEREHFLILFRDKKRGA